MPPHTPDTELAARKTIVIVDDHPMLRRGLAWLIDSEPDLVVCAEAATLPGAVEAIREHQPDLVIVDLALEGRDGLELVKNMKVHHPRIPALVLTMHDGAGFGRRALAAGASGYVTKQELGEALLTAIRQLLAGAQHLSPHMRPERAAR